MVWLEEGPCPMRYSSLNDFNLVGRLFLVARVVEQYMDINLGEKLIRQKDNWLLNILVLL